MEMNERLQTVVNLINAYLGELSKQDESSAKYNVDIMNIYMSLFSRVQTYKPDKLDHVVFTHYFTEPNASERCFRVTRPNPFRSDVPGFTVADILKGVFKELKESIFSGKVPHTVKVEGITGDNYEIEIARHEYSNELSTYVILVNERGIEEFQKNEVVDGRTALSNITGNLMGTVKAAEPKTSTPIIPLKSLVEAKEEPKEEVKAETKDETCAASCGCKHEHEEDSTSYDAYVSKSNIVDRIIGNYHAILEYGEPFEMDIPTIKARKKFLEEFKNVFTMNHIYIANELEVECEVISGKVLVKKTFVDDVYSIFGNNVIDEEWYGKDVEKFVEKLIENSLNEVKSILVKAKVYNNHSYNGTIEESLNALKFNNINGNWTCINFLD